MKLVLMQRVQGNIQMSNMNGYATLTFLIVPIQLRIAGNNNWVKEGMDEVNHQQNYSVSIGGGEQKLNYQVFGSYYKRDGVLRYGPDDNTRYNLKVNVNGELNKYLSVKLTAGYIGSFTNENSYGTDQ